MTAKLGYLLPTRESVMEGRPDAGPLLDLAARAEALGYDSVWVGDSLLARPRHEPLTLLAGVAGRVPRIAIGTAVLLPVLRNPVVLAQMIATVDQVSEGRLILAVGFAQDMPNIRAEFAAAGVPFEKRIGRMMEGLRLCRALWSGKPVDWDGRWQTSNAVMAPAPHRPGGPPLWIGGNRPTSLQRAGKFFDGWFPNSPDPATFARQWQEVQAIARAADRDPTGMTGAMYLTVALDADTARAEARLNAFVEHYYGQPAEVIRRRQVAYAGPAAGLEPWLQNYAEAGATHLVLRFAGDHTRHLDTLAQVRQRLGW
jgi:alkanesulfonate monooxygenase SsuD/methylene tetrahydromethanopterin reductase-like flavin-dependent oxidoreductase (luciferase family)